ncbi:hypothetical protein [Ferruginibacter sp. HRS2-29]|uniref:hypothetical protein n=1 Tax=Ferruginibacter sp. HRS2-29 TaxID=2487334 RepID=UPI0020CF7D6F|nr:hypothetical protein [Ferruginibacter sp. HRS2-29]MCP9753143.1 hypothetical protein [Ferruginibacter sp. HRS2-29]
MPFGTSTKLFLLKMLHSIVWLIFVSAILYVCWCGISNHINLLTWIAIAAVSGEGLVLLVFKGYCPITLSARKYSDAKADNFDIFLPEWLAKYNKVIFTCLFVIGLAIVLWRVLK